MNPSPPIHVIIPVWGEAYTRCFLEVSLPSLLATGNIPELHQQPGHLVHIFTTAEDRRHIEGAPVFHRLLQHVDAHFDQIGIALSATDRRHDWMSDCHRKAIQLADERGAAMLFFNPDIVIASGAIKSLIRLLKAGKRAVQVLGVRLAKDEIVPLFKRNYSSENRTVINIAPRQLVSLGMKHLHELALCHIYNEEKGNLLPQQLFWRVGDEGLVARCFHLHPLLVYPTRQGAEFTTTIDDDYLRAACPDSESEHVVSDSDELCLFELSGRERALTAPTVGEFSIAKWAVQRAKPHHFEHVCRRVILHSGMNNTTEWTRVQNDSDRAIRDILRTALELKAAPKYQNRWLTSMSR